MKFTVVFFCACLFTFSASAQVQSGAIKELSPKGPILNAANESLRLERERLEIERKRFQLEQQQSADAKNKSAEKERSDVFDKVLDFVKTVFATFLGAFLAFRFGLRQQRLQKRSEQQAAGNLAIVTLKRQLSDFTIFMHGVKDTREKRLNKYPNAPVWTQLLPTMFTFTESLRFDFKSLML